MSKCYKGGQQHKFEPRYDEKDRPGNIKSEDYSGDSMENIRKLYIIRKYVKDVCSWCGKEIKR
jgi:hypothetical protein